MDLTKRAQLPSMIGIVLLLGALLLAACQGEPGAQGAQGEPGLNGGAGPAGAAGPQGAVGSQGVQGSQGIQGPAGQQGPVGDVVAATGAQVSLPALDTYTISMEPVGHWHVGANKKVLFSVTESETGEPASVKNLSVQVVRTGSSRVTTRTVDAGQVVFEGEGLYSLEYTPSDFSPYAFSAQFEEEGQVFSSAPWPVELAKAGEEGIRVDVGGNTYVYQIRYNWEPGHAHSSDTETATQVFEVLRGVPEGDAINWDQPWTNTWDYITDIEHAEVVFMAEDGTVVEEIHCIYKGKGIYESERAFPPAEVGHDGRDYLVAFRFTDPYNGAEVGNEEMFPLHVSSPH